MVMEKYNKYEIKKVQLLKHKLIKMFYEQKHVVGLTGFNTGVTMNAGPHKNCSKTSQVGFSLQNLDKIFTNSLTEELYL